MAKKTNTKITTTNPTACDQSAIPRPLNCFLMYRLEKQKEIVAKCSAANHRDLSKVIAKWWQEASENEKAPYREKARIAKMEHHKLYPDYKYKPKRSVAPKRVYIRKNKNQQFTSRAKDNNKIMEMIYEDPTALENITTVEIKEEEPVAKVEKKAKISKKMAEDIENTVVMAETVYEDVDDDYRGYSSPFSSCRSVPDFCYGESQATSPFTESETDMPISMPFVNVKTESVYDEEEFMSNQPILQYAESSCYDQSQSTSPSIASYNEYDMSGTSYFSQNQYYSENMISPYKVLDSPVLNESNAYSSFPLAEQLDYFNINPNGVLDYTQKNSSQEVCWNSFSYAFSQQYPCDTGLGFINPALLHLM